MSNADKPAPPSPSVKVDIEAARTALSELHTMAQGHDYANEYELRQAWSTVDDALDELERRMGQGSDARSMIDAMLAYPQWAHLPLWATKMLCGIARCDDALYEQGKAMMPTTGPASSEGLHELAEKAAEARDARKDEDVDVWAEKLAASVPTGDEGTHSANPSHTCAEEVDDWMRCEACLDPVSFLDANCGDMPEPWYGATIRMLTDYRRAFEAQRLADGAPGCVECGVKDCPYRCIPCSDQECKDTAETALAMHGIRTPRSKGEP